MSEGRLLHGDEGDGIVATFHYDYTNDMVTIASTQDVAPLLDVNKALFNDFDERARWGRDINQVASVPLVLYDKFRKLTQPERRAWLNDPDNRYFRTRPGRI